MCLSFKLSLLTISYKHVPAKPRGEVSGVIGQSLPMAAMFMRNKMLSWAAVFIAIQSYLNQPDNKPADDKDSSAEQPPLLRILFAVISMATCYVDLLFPHMSPVAKPVADVASETVTSIISSATASK